MTDPEKQLDSRLRRRDGDGPLPVEEGHTFAPRSYRPARQSLLTLGLAAFCVFGAVAALRLPSPPHRPEAPARFNADLIGWTLDPVRKQLELGAFPGAAVAMGVRDVESVEMGMGRTGWTRNAAPVDPARTIYDLASLTKVIATTSAIMLLAEEGKLSLDDPVSRYFPSFGEGPKAAVTIRHLLTHTSGLPEGASLRSGRTRAERIARAAALPIYPPAGARVEYSDLGFILAGEIAAMAAGEPMPDYLERRLFRPLGMHSTGFLPGLECELCAPTGRLRDQSLYRGKPFDPLAQRLDGIAGSAGLFSTAHDVGRFAAMLANEGVLDGVRVFSAETISLFTRPQPLGQRFRLGWETMCGMVPADEESCEWVVGIGHTGWTGTSIWIDPDSGIWTVLLTNRTYEPRAPNQLQEVRRELFARATGRSTPTPTLYQRLDEADPGINID